MADLSLSLSLLPVGPRSHFVLKKDATWRFALQVAVGFTDKPPEDEIEAWADATLPWVALAPVSSSIELEWGLFAANQKQAGDAVAGIVQGELALQPGSAMSPRQLLDKTARWHQFVRDPQPPRVFALHATRTPVETSLDQLYVPTVIQALGGASPQLASGELQCTWYFDIVVSDALITIVNDLQGKQPVLAAWPRRFKDARVPVRDFEYAPASLSDTDFDSEGVLSIPYRFSTEEPRRSARTLPITVKGLMNTSEPALKTYWLPTSDSRLDSLAEIQQVVAQSRRPSVRVAFLTPESVLKAGIGAANDPADARLFLQVARKVFVDQRMTEAEQETEAKAVRDLIGTAFLKGDVLAGLRTVLIDDATNWWTAGGAIAAVNQRAITDGLSVRWPTTNVDANALFAEFGDFMLPKKSTARPVLPGAGLDVLLGSPADRLRHQDATNAGNDSDHAQIAELGVLARRAGTADALNTMPWSLVTGAVAAVDTADELKEPDRYWGSVIAAGSTDETIPYDPNPLVRGIKSVFLNGVAHTDINYQGLPMTVNTVGSALHGVQGKPGEGEMDIADLLPLSYQPVGPIAKAKNTSHQRCLVPPLRFGDWYQFAGFVIDRAGGIPAELVKKDERPVSSHIDWDKLAPGAIAALDETKDFNAIQYLRAVPVGEINIRPSHAKANRRPEWPALPGGVVLRAREWLSAQVKETDNVPALLLRKGSAFSDELASYQFRVTAPALDEHTFKEWMMPSAVPPGDGAALEKARTALVALNERVAKIHFDRANLPEKVDWAAQQDVLPLDPAVAQIGLRCTFVDALGIARTTESFLAVEADLRVQIGLSSDVTGNDVTLVPGTFAALELVPLIAAGDFMRFESLAMRELVEDDQWVDAHGNIYTAFKPSRILIEAATPLLPSARELYEALTLREMETGAIDVSLSATNKQPLANAPFVDSFDLHRERLVWRNRPILVANGEPQGAPPKAVADAAQRDRALEVLQFDDLASLDNGFVNRGRIGGRLPRAADGAPLAMPRLVIDDRDAATHADYLRFGCGLISRYAGVLHTDHKRVDAESTHDTDDAKHIEPRRRVKRIAATFRGDVTTLKAPKVLAILPLTKGLPPPAGVDASPDATPFQIVLDEVWFREYGIGERLSVEVVLETKEIGEKDTEKRPFRIGPLPDHYVTAHLDQKPFTNRRLHEPSTDDMQDLPDPAGSSRVTWTAVGPHGYSLDRSGNEALANATAFVVYPPANVRAHYAAFVRLRRKLFHADGTPLLTRDEKPQPVEGPPGATYALYTQPDASRLVAPESTLRINLTSRKWEGAGFTLKATDDLHADVERQYRYLLIAGPVHRDSGRGSDLFLPDRAAWVYRATGTVTWIGDARPAGTCSGRILEVLVNGRFADGQAPIEVKTPGGATGPQSLREVLKLLFAHDKNPEDALGMIRRYSDMFHVHVEP